MICYDTTRISVYTGGTGPAFDPLRCDANKAFLTHYQNFLTLEFFSKNGTIKERAQANRELEICRRKMQYWKRQPHFNHAASIEQIKSTNRACAR